MQRIVLLGSNIAHSWSPRIHNYLFERYALPYRYELMPLTADALPAALERMKAEGYRGANITSPHKEILYDLLDERSRSVERIGAVNTIVIEDGKAFGHNTDIEGFRRSLWDEALLREPFTAAVLGTGGGARAAADVLLGLETLQELCFYSRSPEKGEWCRRHWADERLRNGTIEEFRAADLIVHATPVGLPGREGSLLEPDALRGGRLLYEMIYHPPVTSLMRAAAGAGLRTIGGREMFIAQAVAAFRLWTGIEVDPQELPVDLL